MTGLRGDRWTASNRPEPSRAHGRGRSPSALPPQTTTQHRLVPPREDPPPQSSTHTTYPHTPVPPIRGARGPERGGPTRSHPEPGRDPPQRRRVLWGCPTGGEAAASPPDRSDISAEKKSQKTAVHCARPFCYSEYPFSQQYSFESATTSGSEPLLKGHLPPRL